MTRRRFLPKHVSRFLDRHGKERLRFRRKGFKDHYFLSSFGTPEFAAEYHRCVNPEVGETAGENETPASARYATGTIGGLRRQYYSPITRLGPTEVTQGKIMAVLDSFCSGREDRPVRLVTFQHIDAIIAKRREKSMVQTSRGLRPFGGIHAARKLRKELIRFFDFAIKLDLIGKNPAELSDPIKVAVSERTNGFHSWTEEEIAQYRAYWPLGARQRLAMELLLWTDQRRCDVVAMGKAQIKDGRIPVTQEKTGAELWIPVAPQLLEAIVAMDRRDTSPFIFLMTRRGGPFTKESFGNWFKDACVAAGLLHCTAHGLRKATLRRMADLEMANGSMKALSGQTRDETLAIYTRAANQKRLADNAIAVLSAWEMSNLDPKVRQLHP